MYLGNGIKNDRGNTHVMQTLLVTRAHAHIHK